MLKTSNIGNKGCINMIAITLLSFSKLTWNNEMLAWKHAQEHVRMQKRT